MSTEQKIQILTEQFNGNHWENYGHNRIYFDGADIAKHQGMSWSGYNSGNIRSASIDGRKISNSEARRILDGFAGKIWYCLNHDVFRTSDETDYPVSQEMYEQFTAEVLEAIEEGN